jgi:hypothetical protein
MSANTAGDYSAGPTDTHITNAANAVRKGIIDMNTYKKYRGNLCKG